MKKLAESIFYSALEAVNPYKAAFTHTAHIRDEYVSGRYERLLVIGFGKAAAPMAKAIEDELADLITDGLVITKHGHAEGYELERISICEASHPVPCQLGSAATDRIIRLTTAADERTLVVTLISGGGSALFLAPADGITLCEKQEVTSLLLKAGADINEMNCVRKHLSKVKGGRLAEIIQPARNISLILSDVMGDRLDVIASGPTAPDSSTFAEALSVLDKYAIRQQVPASVLKLLQDGIDGAGAETPKADNSVFNQMENIIIASNRLALEAALAVAVEAGMPAEVISSEISGEARDVGRAFARRALEIKNSGAYRKPACLISGGETTVTVRGHGKGGRNTEMALAFAMEVEGADGITFLSAGTDGNDGPTDAAGAIVNGHTIRYAAEKGLDSVQHLNNNDSYHFFKKLDQLLITGPTGTNVMDMQIVIIN